MEINKEEIKQQLQIFEDETFFENSIFRIRIARIGKVHNIKIRLDGLDILWKYTTFPDKRTTSHKSSSLFYLIQKPFRELSWKIKLFINTKIKNPKEICECCGEGFATYMIDEPNGENYSVTACDGCVDFYDWSYTRKKQEEKYNA